MSLLTPLLLHIVNHQNLLILILLLFLLLSCYHSIGSGSYSHVEYYILIISSLDSCAVVKFLSKPSQMQVHQSLPAQAMLDSHGPLRPGPFLVIKHIAPHCSPQPLCKSGTPPSSPDYAVLVLNLYIVVFARLRIPYPKIQSLSHFCVFRTFHSSFKTL